MKVEIVGDDYTLALPHSMFLLLRESFKEYLLDRGEKFDVLGYSCQEAQSFISELSRRTAGAGQGAHASGSSQGVCGEAMKVEIDRDGVVLTLPRFKFLLLVDVLDEHLLDRGEKFDVLGHSRQDAEAFANELARHTKEARERRRADVDDESA